MTEHDGPLGPDIKREDVAYQLEGDFLEVCDCFTICPCWTGRSPDEEVCTGVFAWVIAKGEIDDVRVAGRTVVSISTHEGHRDQAHQRVHIFVDEAASDAEIGVLAPTFAGLRGGPLGDLGRILGELHSVERKAIRVETEGRRTRLTVDRSIEAEAQTMVGPNGEIMTLANARLSSVLGNPAEVGVASRFRIGMPGTGIDIDLHDRSAMRGAFAYRHNPEKP
jgi:hypothetical protein